jgi:hypothetical protein
MPRSVSIHPDHKQTVEDALKRNGFLTQGDLAAHLDGMALSTVSNFFNAKKVAISTFEKICEALGLDKREIQKPLESSQDKNEQNISIFSTRTTSTTSEQEQVNRSNKKFAPNSIENIQQLKTSNQYYDILTSMVTKNNHGNILYVSVGEGDFLYAWLTRLYQESPLDLQPKINKLVIKRLSDEIIDNYTIQGRLAKNFKNRLEINIASIREDDQLERNKIEIGIRYWKSFPEFHGYLYGHEMLTGKWENNINGNLHVKTQLYYTTKKISPKQYEIVKIGFN